MARQAPEHDISPTLAAAKQWINSCLIEDGSVFSDSLWTAALVDEVYQAFVKHPDESEDVFISKLKGQMKEASPSAKRLMAEMLWALLLFPSNIKPSTKRQQVLEIWGLSGDELRDSHPLLQDDVLKGIGSGGTGFNNYRPHEMAFLIDLTADLKQRGTQERQRIFSDYDCFIAWIESVEQKRREDSGVLQKGRRQFRHMLRFFAFPDRVERMSSNNDRRRILEAFHVASFRETASWTDQKLDDALLKLRAELVKIYPLPVFDFYEPSIKAKWSEDRKIKTPEGEVTVTVPKDDDDDSEEKVSTQLETKAPEARQSIEIQSKLATIGATIGFKIWLPKSDRGRVGQLVTEGVRAAFVEDLPLNYDMTTIDTIEQIDVLWLKGRSIARAFEVEHTTAVYSGLLRMADLIALQPNMDIRLHIVAPDERREKVFKEMRRPVFAYLERGPLSKMCTFISYESVNTISAMKHLAYTKDSIIEEYEEPAEL